MNVELLVKETGEVKEQELFMGDFPLMTENGTFIINGAERVVVSQLVRSPGVYFTLERDATTGRDLCYAKLIPNRGAWLEFETSQPDVISVKVDRKRKIPVTTLLRAIDEPELLPKHPSSDADQGDRRRRSTNAKTEREADKLRHQLLQVSARTSASSRCSRTSTTTRTTTTSRRRWTATRTSSNKEEALLEFYRRLRPGDPPTLENATRTAQLAVLQPAPLRPGQGRPLQAEQAPRPRRRHTGERMLDARAT